VPHLTAPVQKLASHGIKSAFVSAVFPGPIPRASQMDQVVAGPLHRCAVPVLCHAESLRDRTTMVTSV